MKNSLNKYFILVIVLFYYDRRRRVGSISVADKTMGFASNGSILKLSLAENDTVEEVAVEGIM